MASMLCEIIPPESKIPPRMDVLLKNTSGEENTAVGTEHRELHDGQ